MKLVVGLGNPGRKYEGTRHNVGFEVLASLARRYDVGRPRSKFNAEVCETSIKNEKTVLISPLTYMNLSGQSVRAAFDFYKLSLTDVLIICDDISLPVARLRLKPGGSSGGQNGLNDIIKRLGSRDFCRLRLGVGQVPNSWDAADYVLGKFSKDDRELIDIAVVRAADAVETWIEDGIAIAMNKFNPDPYAPPKPPKQKKKRKQESSTELDGSAAKKGDPKSPDGNKENKDTDDEK